MTPGDERFAQSMADLSSRMRVRMAERPPTDPMTALKRRQAALKEFDRERRQKWMLALAGLGCVVAAGALAWAIVMIAEPDTVVASTPAANVQTASVEPAKPPASPPGKSTRDEAARSALSPPPETMPASVDATTSPARDPAPAAKPIEDKPPQVKQADAMPPAAPPPPAASQATASPAAAPSATASSAAVPSASSAPVTATLAVAQAPPPLPRRDIVEAQRLLTGFGFDPGPIDGNAGPRTLDAVSRYQERRGLPQTGELDQATLDQLRQDPAPKAVMTAQRQSPAASSPSPQYSQSRQVPAVFRPIEMAGQQITTWLNSVFR